MAVAIQEALYLIQPLEDFGIQENHPKAIGMEGKSCIKSCSNPFVQKKSKHIETKFHLSRDKRKDGTISIPCIPAEKISADIFAKSLLVSKVEEFRTSLMQTDSTQSAQF